ncbi:MAG: glycoside hydrolase family 43 protein [Piscinibacter sp.]
MSTATIHNPVLPGFHPDPSILRVGEDFYLATSTFEWWPGVRLHHSRDLVHWRPAGYALTRSSQLEMRGNPDSGGIWAPCLSWRDGLFHLIYTNVRSLLGAHKDTHNYLVTAPSIDGPWSEPVYLNSSGFDPSLFHDDDGRSWLLNMQWDHRPGHHPFCGILLQQYDRDARRLAGEVHRIFLGSSLAVTEGPHLYKRDGWYYLLTAEGGTFYEHAVTIARSRSITGPYELSPIHPLLTAHGSSPAGLQRAGHASIVDTGRGEWYLAHLCGRPVEWRQDAPSQAPAAYSLDALHCPLGRETALQKLEWTAEGWPRLAHGDNHPRTAVSAPNLPPEPFPADAEIDHFDGAVLSPHWNTLRAPAGAWLSLSARPGHLRLVGRESLMSCFEQSLVARRQQAFDCEAETELDFAPVDFQQCAGLVAYYNTRNHAYLHVSHDDRSGGRVLRLTVNDRGAPSEPALPRPLPASGEVGLRVRFAGTTLRFSWRVDGTDWQDIGPPLPMALLSDEHATHFEGDNVARSFGFTGNYIGLACQSLGGVLAVADFAYFRYSEG